MRSFGILVQKNGLFRQPTIPQDRIARANPPGAQLVDEAIHAAFELACVDSDLTTATELLTVMENRHSARSFPDAAARRAAWLLPRRMRGELERRHLVAGKRPPPRPMLDAGQY